MSDEGQHDIFEPRLNERGIRYIMKFTSIVKIVILTGVISSLFLFITSVGRIFNDTIDYSILDAWETAFYKSYPYFTVILNILFLFQLYYYWKIKQNLEEAISEKNEATFNGSFEALFKNAVWGVILGVASLVISMIDLLLYRHVCIISFRDHKTIMPMINKFGYPSIIS